MRSVSGILLAAAATVLSPLSFATSAPANPVMLIGPMAPVVGGFSIQAPAASDEGQWQGSTEAAPAPATTRMAPAYDIVCAVQMRWTPYGSRCD